MSSSVKPWGSNSRIAERSVGASIASSGDWVAVAVSLTKPS
jgi:hypothetical protein